MDSKPIVVVGAGLAGLSCARTLCEAGRRVLVLERENVVGGRVRTDRHEGFLLDRGFQVYLTAYPEARRQLNHDRLNLHRFEPGSLIWTGHRFEKLSDPWRRPGQIFQTAFAGVGSLADKLRIARLRWQCLSGTVDELWQRPEQPTIDELHSLGFSERIIQTFFRPFLGGVFLDPALETSSRMLQFVFRMFSSGDAALPAGGMQDIPKQLAESLPPACLRLNTPVGHLQSQQVVLTTGEQIDAAAVVVAAEQAAAARLVPQIAPDPNPRGVYCLYFAAPQSPLNEPILVLNGSGTGRVNNLCVPSDVVPDYSSDGRALVSVTVLENDQAEATLVPIVLDELQNWFGSQVNSWTHLRSYNLPYALPNQSVAARQQQTNSALRREGVWICGDHCTNGSINGALQSGRIAAERILQSQ